MDRSIALWCVLLALALACAPLASLADIPLTVVEVGTKANHAARIHDTQSDGTQNLTSKWSSGGDQSLAWFTVDLGTSATVQLVRIATNRARVYQLAISVGDTLSAGKVLGGQTVTCPTPGGGLTVPTVMDECPIPGISGRYLTIESTNRAWFNVFGLEVSADPGEPTGPIGPVAAFDVTTTADSLTVGLDASASSDADGVIVSHDWDLGDGNSLTGENVSHEYAAAGSYLVTLTVTDDSGLTDATSETVAVPPAQPAPGSEIAVLAVGAKENLASRLLDKLGDDSQNLATKWANDGDRATAWFTLDLGSAAQLSELRIAPTGNRSFNLDIEVGSTLSGNRVTGGQLEYCSTPGNGTKDPQTLDSCPLAGPVGRYITVSSRNRAWFSVYGVEVVAGAGEPIAIPPVARIGASTSPGSMEVQLDASASSDADGSVVAHYWDLGDGGTSADETLSHTYSTSGTYEVQLTVTDDEGLTDQDSATVTVPQPESSSSVSVADVGTRPSHAGHLIDTLPDGSQNLATQWSNSGDVDARWITLDLGAPGLVQAVLIAPAGNISINLSLAIGDNLSGGQVAGGQSASCSVPKTGPQEPSTLHECTVPGLIGRYITIRSVNRNWLTVYGIEVVSTPLGNQPPVITDIPGQTITEGFALDIEVDATDPDGPPPLDLWSTSTLPGSPDVLTDLGDGDGLLQWTANPGDAGVYSVTVHASDGEGDSAEETLTVVVVTNQPPALEPIADQFVTEQQSLSVAISSTDPDGPGITVISQTNTLPGTPDDILTDYGNGTAAIDWTPGSGDGDNSPYSITVHAQDAEGDSTSTTFAVIVAGNLAPQIDPMGDQTVAEGAAMEVPFRVVDTDGPAPLDVQIDHNLPGVPPQIVESEPGIGTISWTAQPGDAAGSPYRITLIATDGRGNQSEATVDVVISSDTADWFQDGTDAAGLTYFGKSYGAAVCDLSGNGYPDVWAPNHEDLDYLWWNEGGYYTRQVMPRLSGDTHAASCTDYDLDGDFDVLIQGGGNKDKPTGGQPLLVYRNDGNRQFTEVSADIGLAAPQARGRHTFCYDWNGDGQVDCARLNANKDDGTHKPNIAIQNAGRFTHATNIPGSRYGQFIYVNNTAYVILTGTHWPQGVYRRSDRRKTGLPGWEGKLINTEEALIGDYLGDDGKVDLFLCRRNLGGWQFQGTGSGWIQGEVDERTCRIAALEDFDNDGKLDIWRSSADGKAFALDYDNDGRMDILQVPPLNLHGPHILHRNAVSNSNHWLKVALVGNAMGARVFVNGQVRYYSPHQHAGFREPVLHFGLGQDTQANVRIEWPSGAVQQRTTGVDRKIYAFDGIGNAPPVLTAIADQTVREGQSVAVGILASDTDGPAPLTLTAEHNLPSEPSLTQDGAGDGLFTFASAVGDAGSYSVTVTATDGLGQFMDQTFALEVVANVPPTIDAIADITLMAGDSVEVAITASDADGAAPVVEVAHSLPDSEFTPAGDGTATLEISSAPGDEGSYPVTVTARDDAGVESNITFNVTIGANLPPVIDPIADQQVREGETVELTISGNDPDGEQPVSFDIEHNLAGTLAFADNADDTAEFSYTPAEGEAGSYSVTVTATDALGGATSLVFNIEIQENLPPEIVAVADQTVAEEQNLQLQFTATDDGPQPLDLLYTHNLPGTPAFTNDATGGGTLDWTADAATAGSYSVTITARDGLGAESSLTFAVTVTVNGLPEVSAVADQTLTEGESLALVFSATDDGPTPLDLEYSHNLPGAPEFASDGSGGGSLAWTSAIGDAGVYAVTITARDGLGAEGSITFAVTVTANGTPSITPVADQAVAEGATLNLTFTASDDGPLPLDLLYSHDLPGAPAFTSDGAGGGTLAWTASADDAGSYSVTITARDGLGSEATETFAVDVTANGAPVVTPVADQAVAVGETLALNFSATDDGPTPLDLLYSHNLPGAPGFTNDSAGGGTLNWTPAAEETGSYSVTVTARDGLGSQSEVTFAVDVTANGVPMVTAIADQILAEGETLALNFAATDDGPTPLDLLYSHTLPGAPVFTNDSTGGGTLSWTAAAGDAGDYTVTVTARDGLGSESATTFAVTVTANGVPNLTPVADQNVAEGELLQLAFAATDDGPTPLDLHYSHNLAGAPAFAMDGAGGGTLNWTPGAGDAGSYSVTVTARDGLGAEAAVTFAVDVTANGNPVVSAVADQTLSEGEDLALVFAATDDGPGPLDLLYNHNLPGAPAFANDGSGGGTLNWSSTTGDAGSYTVTVTARDGLGAEAGVTFAIEVTANGAPVVTPVADQSLGEGETLQLIFAATDDGPTPLDLLYSHNLPGSPAFASDGSGGGSLDWPTVVGDAGTYSVTVTARDALGAESAITFAVDVSANASPVVSPVADQSLAEGDTLALVFAATDDGPGPLDLLYTDNLPGTPVFASDGSGGGSLDWTAAAGDAGNYSVTVTARDGLGAETALTFAIEVTANGLPVVTPVTDQSLGEGETLQLVFAATDDGPTPLDLLYSHNLPGTPAFASDGTGGGTLDWPTALGDAGSYSVTVTARDGLGAEAAVTFAVDITANAVPVVAAVADQTLTEGEPLNLIFSATDDGPGPLDLLYSHNLPGTPAFASDGSGGGTLDWTTASGDAGTYSVTVTARDGLGSESDVTFAVDVAPNGLPVVSTVADQTLTEGQTLQLNFAATDDGPGPLDLLYSHNLPGSPSFTNDGSGSGTLEWQTAAGDAGSYSVTVTARDGLGAEAATTFAVDVAVNASPSIAEVATQNLGEGDTLQLLFTATDDGPTPLDLLYSHDLPGTPVFTSDGSGSGSLDWSASLGDAGSYSVTVTARDGLGAESVISFAVEVAANDTPDITAVADQTLTEGDTLALVFSATDDGPSPLDLLYSHNLPGSPVFTNDSAGGGSLDWTPGPGENGSYSVTITARDGLGQEAFLTFAVTVDAAP